MLIQNMQGFSAGGVAPPPSRAPTTHSAASESKATGTRPVMDGQPQLAVAAGEPAAEQVEAAVTQANRAMAALSAALSFEVDAQTKTMVVKVIDTSDNSVLRQIPSEEMLEIARALDRVQGLLLRDKA